MGAWGAEVLRGLSCGLGQGKAGHRAGQAMGNAAPGRRVICVLMYVLLCLCVYGRARCVLRVADCSDAGTGQGLRASMLCILGFKVPLGAADGVWVQAL